MAYGVIDLGFGPGHPLASRGNDLLRREVERGGQRVQHA
jgi:hypothetical protein